MTGIFELDMAQDAKGNNLLVVDCLNLAFRYKHKRQRNFAADYVRTIESFAKSYKSETVILTADKGKSKYRTDIFPEYKGNRDEKYKDQSDEDKEEFRLFLADFEDALTLASIRWPLLRFQGVEADDIMAMICKLIPNLMPRIEHIWMLTTDRDMDQLINECTSRFCYYTRKEITIDNFFAKYDCTPEEYISLKVLQGDSGDNVPGIPQVGAKRGAGLIKQYGSALDIYDQLPLPGTYKYIQNVNAFGDQILINYQLMDLSFAAEAVGKENIEKIKEVLSEVG